MKQVSDIQIINAKETNKNELKQMKAGGWIADAVEWLICDCHWNYPAGSYHSAMMVRGI